MSSSSSFPPSLSPADEAALADLARLLHLLHHRNSNQHRRSIWYRHFSLLRRHLRLLVSDLASLFAAQPTGHLARVRRKAADLATRQRTEERLVFWRDVLVPRWQASFSQVVADGRFAVLGLVLLAVLSEVCRVVGITAEMERMGQEEVQRVLERFAAEEWGDLGLDPSRKGEARGERDGKELGRGVVGGGEDLGEVVTRESLAAEASSPVTKKNPAAQEVKVAEKTKKKHRPSDLSEKKKKKRKKGGDAIDDLFAGL